MTRNDPVGARRRAALWVAAAALAMAGCGQAVAPEATAPGATPPDDETPGEATPDPTAPVSPNSPAAESSAAESAAEDGSGADVGVTDMGTSLADSLAFDPWLNLGAPGVGYILGPDWLMVSWTLNSTADEPVLVAMGVPRRPQFEGVDPHSMVLPDQRDQAVWAFGTPEGRVRLSQQTFPVLDEADGGSYAVAATVLEPGRGLGGGGQAVLPLQAAIPDRTLFALPGPGDLPAEATEWEFCLQVAPVPEDFDPSAPLITPDTPGAELLCSEPAELPADWATRPANTAPPTAPPRDHG